MNASPKKRPLGSPLAPLAAAASAGILADRLELLNATWLWVDVAVGFAIVAVLLSPSLRRITSFCVLGAFFALGAAWNHAWWFDLPPDDVALGDWSEPKPAWVRGLIDDAAVFRAESGDAGLGSTRTVVAATHMSDGANWRRASGKLLVNAVGDHSKRVIGDKVELVGLVSEIAGPQNPGEFDQMSAMRARGIRLRMFVESSGSLRSDATGLAEFDLSLLERVSRTCIRVLGYARAWSYRRLCTGLDAKAAPLAAALLLGRRDGVDPEVNDAFAPQVQRTCWRSPDFIFKSWRLEFCLRAGLWGSNRNEPSGWWVLQPSAIRSWSGLHLRWQDPLP